MKIIGITDSVNTCDCCGRTDLARTVCFESQSGNVTFYGTTCATRYARRNGIAFNLSAAEIIESAKSIASTFEEFTKEMKRKGFGNVKILSPLNSDVECLTWNWKDYSVKYTDI